MTIKISLILDSYRSTNAQEACDKNSDNCYVYDDTGNEIALVAKEPENSSKINITVKANDIAYYLFTDANPLGEQLFKYVESLKKSDFNFNNPTVFITHGWRNSIESSGSQLLKKGIHFVNF